MKPLYISFDIETDGPCPGIHSMLSLGLAWRESMDSEVTTVQWNLTPTTITRHQPTMNWWAERPEAWEAARVHARHPEQVMGEFDAFVTALVKCTGRPAVFVAYPAGFDFSFLYYYVRRYLGDPAWFTFSCVDIKTLAWAAMGGGGYRSATKRNMPKRWFDGAPEHTHKASEDAHEQLIVFENILTDLEQPCSGSE